MKELTKDSLIGSVWRIVSVAAVGASLWFVQPITSVAADTPTAANPESRQLDFWVGNWTVTAPGSAPNAVSVVRLELDKSLLIESWDGGRGHKGENVFAYSADDKTWHGMFTDNRGRVHVLTGKEIKPGLVEFTGTSGADQMDRVRVTKISDEKVVESWDKSTDHGATWKTEFRGEYSRKSSPIGAGVGWQASAADTYHRPLPCTLAAGLCRPTARALLLCYLGDLLFNLLLC
jgi:hypothetical protein